MDIKEHIKKNSYYFAKDGLLITCVVVLLICIPELHSVSAVIQLLGERSYLLLAVVGMVFVQASGSVDFSCITQSMMTSAFLFWMAERGTGLYQMIFLCILLGVGFGAIKGVAIAKMGIAPTAACICALMIYYGLFTLFETDSSGTYFTATLQAVFFVSVFRIPAIFLAAVAVALATDVFFNRTYYGKEILSTKLAPNVAKRAGINSEKIVIGTSAICGALMSFSSTVYVSSVCPIDAAEGIKILAQTVTLTHLSGASMSPKSYGVECFRTWRVVLTVLLLAILEESCALYTVPAGVMYIFYGLFTGVSIMSGKEAGGRRRSKDVFLKL